MTTSGPPGGGGPRGVVLCVEHPLYQRYLEEQFARRGDRVLSIRRDDLVPAVAENPHRLLLLQSDEDEYGLLEVARKLRRIFADELRVVFLSADYQSAEEAASAADTFLQYPARFEAVVEAMRRAEDTTRRILLIDDSTLVHNHLVPPLRGAGYDVLQAFDGQEGLDAAGHGRPDLVITDIEMPGLNGFEVAAAIRASPGIRDTYIIMSSTLGSAADQQRGFEAGVDEYIIKPVVVPELLDRIKKVFRSALTGRESILVVERDEQLVKNIAKSLGKQGFSTRSVATVGEAVRLLRRVRYDLVLSCLDLPDGSALDLFAAIRAFPDDARPDVIIMTARDSVADARMVTNAGAAGVISKPFTMDALLAGVERAVADRRAALEKAQLSKYVSKASLRMALEKAILSGKGATARADRKRAAVFFSDIVSFTTRCERYTPRDIVAQINGLFEVMTRVIMENDGDIDKFIGDACMAVWMHDDVAVAAERAVRSYLLLRRAIDAMNRQSPLLAADPIRIRVGINAGDLILCDLGSASARIDLTVIGDSVNIAARLESAARQYGVDNLMGGAVVRPVMDRYGVRLIDLVRVKGKTEPIECYEIFGPKADLTPPQVDLLRAFSAGIDQFREGHFEKALTEFEGSQRLEAGQEEGQINPSRVYIDRCRQLLAQPPARWEGIWELHQK